MLQHSFLYGLLKQPQVIAVQWQFGSVVLRGQIIVDGARESDSRMVTCGISK